jgi:hypothetical protein
MRDIVVEDITFVGIGRESDSCAFRFIGASDVTFNRIKMKLWGYASIQIFDCINVNFLDCIFDDIYKSGYGYAIVMVNAVDQILVKDCDFITCGRHFFATGATSSKAGWAKGIRIENCLFKDSTGEAVNMHRQSIGPMEVINCDFIDCAKGVETLNAHTLIDGCDFINVLTPFDLGHYSEKERGKFVHLDKFERQHIVRNCIMNSPTLGQGKINAHNILFEGNTFDNVRIYLNKKLSERSVMNPLRNIQVYNNIFQNIEGEALLFFNYCDYVHMMDNTFIDSGEYWFEDAGEHIYINTIPPDPLPSIETPQALYPE